MNPLKRPLQEPHPDHDRGLEFDLSTLLSRRRSLGLFLGAGTAAALAACTPGQSSGPAASAGSGAASGGSPAGATAAASPSASPALTREIAECGVQIPRETSGPFPGDGSNRPNVLAASGVVRRDITASFGPSSTKADGVPLTVTLTLLDNAQNDGGIYQLAAMTGSVSAGYTAALNVTV